MALKKRSPVLLTGEMKAINWNEEDAGVTFTYEDIPADMQELAEEWHQNLIESAAEASEELMEKYWVVKN